MSDIDEMINAMKKDKEGGPKKFWSPASDKEGQFPIRILPPLKDKGEKVFYFRHRVHWINNKSYECLRQDITDKNGNAHASGDCPVCRFVSQLYSTAEKGSDDWELAGKLRAQDRYIYRVIVRGKEDETKPEFFESGKTIFEILYHIIAETDFGNITDLKAGRDFILSKKGTGRKSKYETSTASANISQVFKSTEEIKSLSEKWKQMDYSKLIDVVDEDSMKRALKDFINGNTVSSSSSDDDVVEEVAPKAAPKKTAPAPVESRDEPDDEIDDILNSL